MPALRITLVRRTRSGGRHRREDSRRAADRLQALGARSDLVMWDNRCTMHRRDPFDAAARRMMRRTQAQGEAPPAA